MKLYLVRHGQSVPNFERRHSGWSQWPLTEQGFADAKRAGRLLKGIDFDRIYSGDLCRAVQTARTAIPGCEPIQLPVLRERGVGILQEKRIEDCFAEYGDEYRLARQTLDFTPFGGESIQMLRARAAQFLKMLEEDPCENVVAFTHEGLVSCAADCVLGVELERSRITVLNGAVTVLNYSDGRWRLQLGGTGPVE